MASTLVPHNFVRFPRTYAAGVTGRFAAQAIPSILPCLAFGGEPPLLGQPANWHRDNGILDRDLEIARKRSKLFFMDRLSITTASDCLQELTKLYNNGMPPGYPSGWDSMNEFYTVLPGQLTLVTGVPSHGKSTWVECLSVNLAWMGWKFAIYSPEHEPAEVHIATLCEKVLRKPFRKNFNGFMQPSDLANAVAFIDEHYRFLHIPKEQNDVPTMQDVLETASQAFNAWDEESGSPGQYGLIIDPWNELNHELIAASSETQYIGATLGMLRRYCRNWGNHCWLVAHPKQLLKHPKTGEYPIPRPYDISGSAHWYNKADNCITVWRTEDDTTDVEVHIQKVKFRHVGKKGTVTLTFNAGTGTYADREDGWHGYSNIPSPNDFRTRAFD